MNGKITVTIQGTGEELIQLIGLYNLAQAGVSATLEFEVKPTVAQLAKQANQENPGAKINAIKRLRELAGITLAEAKDAIEADLGIKPFSYSEANGQ